MKKRDDDANLSCSFCGKSQREVKKLIAGPTVFICDECVDICLDIIAEDRMMEQQQDASLPKPREINEFLEQYVIGQDLAKKKPIVRVGLGGGLSMLETAEELHYEIIAGVYSDEDVAAAQLTRVLDAGLSASLVSGSTANKLVFELRVGPYPEIDVAERTAAILEESYGFTPYLTVVRMPPTEDAPPPEPSAEEADLP